MKTIEIEDGLDIDRLNILLDAAENVAAILKAAIKKLNSVNGTWEHDFLTEPEYGMPLEMLEEKHAMFEDYIKRLNDHIDDAEDAAREEERYGSYEDQHRMTGIELL